MKCTSRASLKAHSQNTWLLANFARGGTITSLEAARKKNITSLHRRLAELRDRGHPVDYGTIFVTRNGVRMKRYAMARGRH